MTDYTELYDHVLPEVNGCMPEMALIHIRASVIDFCKRTGVLVKPLDDISVVAGTSAYPLLLAGYKVSGIREASLDGEPLTPIARDQRRQTARTEYFYSDKVDEIILSGTPTADGVLSVTASAYPLNDSIAVDDWVIDRYQDEILDGIKWRLFRIPKKSWTDLRLSQNYYARFLNATYRIRDHVYSGLHNRSNKRVTVHPYG